MAESSPVAPEQRAPDGSPVLPGPEVLWSAEPSRRSLRFARVLRLSMRPLLTLSTALSALGLRFGPKGIEMWRVWTWLHLVVDRISGLARPDRGTTVQRIRLNDCRAEYVWAPGVAPGGTAILYFHGGGFVAGGLAAYRRFAGRMSGAAGATVLNVGYRLLPRNPIGHAIADGLDGYRRLLADGHRPEQIVIGGDSAGGGLAFLVAFAIKERGLPRPAGIVGLSPWANLDVSEKIAHPAARTDPVIPIRAAAFVVEKLIQRGVALDERLSPVNLDLRGLPPALIHAGTTEVLALDSIELADTLAAGGVPVTLKHWRGQVHVFQVLGLDALPEARLALAEIGAFVREHAAR